MFQMVLNTSLHQAKKESGSHKKYHENDEDCFLVKLLARSENSKKSLGQKINDFQYYDRPFSQEMPSVNSF